MGGTNTVDDPNSLYIKYAIDFGDLDVAAEWVGALTSAGCLQHCYRRFYPNAQKLYLNDVDGISDGDTIS